MESVSFGVRPTVGEGLGLSSPLYLSFLIWYKYERYIIRIDVETPNLRDTDFKLIRLSQTKIAKKAGNVETDYIE